MRTGSSGEPTDELDDSLDDESQDDNPDDGDEEESESEDVTNIDNESDEEEEEEEPSSGWTTVGQKKKYAGRYDTPEELETAYRATQSHKDRADATLKKLGYVYDRESRQYVQKTDPQRAATRQEATVATPQEEEWPETEPLETLDHDFLDEEARTGKFGKGEQGWPLDRYGNQIISDEGWDKFAEDNGLTDSQKEKAILRYESQVTASRQKAWFGEQQRIQTLTGNVEQRHDRESSEIVNQFMAAYPQLADDVVKTAGEHYVNMAKEALSNAVKEGKMKGHQAAKPGALTNMVRVVLDAASKSGDLRARLTAKPGAQTRRAEARRDGRVLRTRVAEPVPEGDEDEPEDTPSNTVVIGAKNGQAKTEGKYLARLTPDQREQLEYWAEELGVRDLESYAEECTKSGRFRKRNKR